MGSENVTQEGAEAVPVSALNHYIYCPRRCALVHVEKVWDENLYTLRGRDVHEHVDEVSSHELAGVRYERALPLWSTRLNLVGKADLVEFHGDVPYPVEYKSGRRKSFLNDQLQLCAQAICLEEMFEVPVERGAFYWHGSRERREVAFTGNLRAEVERVAAAVHEILANHRVPGPVNDHRCGDCSLNESCLPSAVGEKGRVRKVMKALFSVEEGS